MDERSNNYLKLLRKLAELKSYILTKARNSNWHVGLVIFTFDSTKALEGYFSLMLC